MLRAVDYDGLVVCEGASVLPSRISPPSSVVVHMSRPSLAYLHIDGARLSLPEASVSIAT
jgi:hypothetical protein